MPIYSRWQALSELVSQRKELDRLFNQAFHQPFANLEGFGVPTIDVYQTEREVVVRASLPGAEPEGLDIKVTGDALTLRGEVKHEEETQNDQDEGQVISRYLGSSLR